MDEPVKIDATVPVAPISVVHGEGQPVSVTEHVTLSEPEPQIPAEVAGHVTVVPNNQVPNLTNARGAGLTHSAETNVPILDSAADNREELIKESKGSVENSSTWLSWLKLKVKKMFGGAA